MPELLYTRREIRTATSQDLAFIDDLQKKHAKAVAFRPRIALENYTNAGAITLALENDEPAGYLLANPQLRYQPEICPIFQAAVAMDAQRRHHGIALLATVAQAAKAAGKLVIQANCREELEANEFWNAAGFEPIAKIFHFAHRQRWLICWRLQLTTKRPTWFETPPAFAGSRNARTREI
jgi:N-acetylglutamate synthase-like GNAT family acetyltransferase